MELPAPGLGSGNPPNPPNPPLPTTPYSWQDGRTLRLYITDESQAIPIFFSISTNSIKVRYQADKAMSRFQGPCGIDIEWKPNFRKGEAENPVALLQLVNRTSILLLHLFHMKTFPAHLKTFLEDPNVVKAGVGIQGDAKKMYKDCLVNIRNCVDLSLLARSVDNTRWKGRYRDPIGLARLIAAYEDRLLSKGKITRSNWENHLDPEQLEYHSLGISSMLTCSDGHAGYTLYMKLSSMLHSIPKIPSPTCYTFDAVRGRLCEPSGMTWTPFNPDYDPGPPPPPRPPMPAQSTGSSTSHGAVALSPGYGSSRLKRPLAPDSGPSVSTGNHAGARDNSKRQRYRPRNKKST
ncbi:ribonuclease H-like domain-containing protein [Mycena maculata]|uniref:3'-5' exonuclease n=1 Tax=Mycena maculata TaxID=230809 RepID=A0AAD7JUH6_9AGAR|nr:ribonuclease H-like domain-containing protein [Mycena maculata]